MLLFRHYGETARWQLESLLFDFGDYMKLGVT